VRPRRKSESQWRLRDLEESNEGGEAWRRWMGNSRGAAAVEYL
jgi:hypothetical protein